MYKLIVVTKKGYAKKLSALFPAINTMNIFSTSKSDNKKELEEKEIKHLENYIKDFWRFLPLPICYASPSNIVLDVDEAFVDFSKYDQSDIVGEDLAKFFSETDGKMKELKEEIATKERVAFDDMAFLTKGKGSIPVDIVAMQRKDDKGEFIGYFMAIIDVSRVKEKVDQLERFKELTLGREMEMIDLKEEVKILKEVLDEKKTEE